MNAPAIAFFDVDHTLTRHSTGYYLTLVALRRGLVRPSMLRGLPSMYLRYHFGPKASGGEGLLPEFFPAFAGIPEAELRAAAAHAVERYIMPSIFPGAAELVERTRAAGTRVVLATSSFDMLIDPVADRLGASEVIATVMEFSGGRTTGRFTGGLNLGTRKLARCRAAAGALGIALADCAFYSDSVHDLPLLLEVGQPVAVNPDARLRAHARSEGWPVIDWKRRLR